MNEPQHMHTASGVSLIRRLAWLPLPLLAAALAVLWVADLRAVWQQPFLYGLVHYGGAALAVGLIAVPAALGFAANGQPSVLMLGAGVLLTVIGAAGAGVGFKRSLDTGFAIYNTSVLLSALCHFTGVVIATRRKTRLRRTATWLTAAYGGGAAAMALVIGAAFKGWMPAFFVDGHGGTLVRAAVVIAAVALFGLTAGLLWQASRRMAAPFFYWYALGLGLLALGLAGSMAIVVQDSPLQWLTRYTQFFGTVYMCVAVLASSRAGRVEGVPLAAVEEAWQSEAFLAGMRRQTPIGWALRYGLAVVAVAVAMGARLALTVRVGPGLPAYITFYPAVMAVALVAGLGPGLLATALAGLLAASWILPPVGPLADASRVDRLGLAIFIGMGLFMSLVADLYRRKRDQAAAYDRAAALRESQARLAAFAEATFEGIVETEAGRIVDCNEQFARMLGYAVEEMRGLEIARLVAPEDLDRVNANIRQGRDSTIEHIARRKDGTRIVIEAHGRPVSPGSSRRHTAVRDITAYKQAEMALQQMNAELERRVAERTAELRRVNETLEQRVAERVGEVQKANEDLDASRRAALNLMEDAIAARNQAERDRAKLERATEALRASEERLRLAQEAADIEVWDYDPRAGVMQCGARVKAWWGLPPEEAYTYDAWLARLHPKDREAAVAEVRRSLEPNGPGRQDLEYRVAQPAGTVRWISVHAQAQFADVDGRRQAVRIIGTMQDISARKQIEAQIMRQVGELQAANEELARFNRVAVDRELRMVQLKKQVNELCRERGQPDRYKVDFAKEKDATQASVPLDRPETRP